jgi:hypothetical protein
MENLKKHNQESNKALKELAEEIFKLKKKITESRIMEFKKNEIQNKLSELLFLLK